MNPTALQQLEELLETSLPADYLDHLRDYPTTLRSARRAIDNSDAEGTVAQVEFLDDLASVLEVNLEVRCETLVQPDGEEQLWPPQFLIIGETGSGDYYCIDAGREVQGVMQYDHQSVQFEVFADSIDEFVEMLEDTFCDAESF